MRYRWKRRDLEYVLVREEVDQIDVPHLKQVNANQFTKGTFRMHKKK